MNILYLTNIPSPYRMNYFNLLGRVSNLTVVFESMTAASFNSSWFSEKPESFESVFLDKGPLNYKKFDLKMLQYLNPKKYDVIIATNYSSVAEIIAILYMRIMHIPFILEVDGGFPKSGRGIKEWLKNIIISAASYWLSTGTITDQYLKQYGAKKEKIVKYPFTSLFDNEILVESLATQEKSNIKKALGLKETKCAVAVGQLIHRKGFDVLLKAWKNMPKEMALYIIGDGEKKDELRDAIEKLSLENVKLIDFKAKKDLLQYYKAADLFILPTREDIWGLVINEAMACGLPVITTENCIAGVELVGNGENGYIIPVENVDLLYEYSLNILSDEQLQRRMACSSLEKIKWYTFENMVKIHLECFNKYLCG